jgi:hypothetical protein
MSLPCRTCIYLYSYTVTEHTGKDMTWQFTVHPRLQVQTLWLTFALCLQYSLSCRAEVLHVDTHSPLTESQQTRLGTNGLDVGTGQIVLLVDELVQIDVFVQGHLGGVEGEDLLLGRLCLAVNYNAGQRK